MCMTVKGRLVVKGIIGEDDGGDEMSILKGDGILVVREDVLNGECVSRESDGLWVCGNFPLVFKGMYGVIDVEGETVGESELPVTVGALIGRVGTRKGNFIFIEDEGRDRISRDDGEQEDAIGEGGDVRVGEGESGQADREGIGILRGEGCENGVESRGGICMEQDQITIEGFDGNVDERGSHDL